MAEPVCVYVACYIFQQVMLNITVIIPFTLQVQLCYCLHYKGSPVICTKNNNLSLFPAQLHYNQLNSVCVQEGERMVA